MRLALLTLAWVTAASVAHAQERDPEVQSLYRRARTAQQATNHPAAKALYDSVLARDSMYAAAYNNRGNVRRRMGDVKGAIDDYTAAIRVNDRYALAYRNRAAARKELGDVRAIEDLNRAIAVDPANPDGWYDRGVLKYERGLVDDGLGDIRRAAALNHQTARRYLAGRGEAPPVMRNASVEPAETRRRDSGVRFVTSLLTLRALVLVALVFATLGVLMWLPLRSAKRSEIVHVEAPPGQRLLWIGAPRQGLLLRSGDGFGIVFSLVWTAVVLAFTGWGILSLGPAAILIGSPFLLFAWYFLMGRFFHDAWRRKHTVYALTDRSVMIMRGRSARPLSLDKLPALVLEEWRDGTGTISFGPTNAQRSMQPGRKRQLGWSVSPAFELIADAPRVFAMIEQARQALDVTQRIGIHEERQGSGQA